MDNSITGININTAVDNGGVYNGVNNIALSVDEYSAMYDEQNITCIGIDYTRHGYDIVMFI